LLTDNRLDKEARLQLLIHATEMYLGGEAERQVEGEYYEGCLYNTGEFGVIGTLGGVKFRAELDTDEGRAVLQFLVNEQSRSLYMTPDNLN